MRSSPEDLHRCRRVIRDGRRSGTPRPSLRWLFALTVLVGCDAGAEEPLDEVASTGGPEATVGEADESGSTDGDDSSGSEETGEAPPSAIPDRECPPDRIVDAQSFGMPFMATWCASCHGVGLVWEERRGAPVGVDLDTIEGVRSQLLRVYARSADDHDTMPPAGGPTPEERAWLGDWLACGAP